VWAKNRRGELKSRERDGAMPPTETRISPPVPGGDAESPPRAGDRGSDLRIAAVVIGACVVTGLLLTLVLLT